MMGSLVITCILTEMGVNRLIDFCKQIQHDPSKISQENLLYLKISKHVNGTMKRSIIYRSVAVC